MGGRIDVEANDIPELVGVARNPDLMRTRAK